MVWYGRDWRWLNAHPPSFIGHGAVAMFSETTTTKNVLLIKWPSQKYNTKPHLQQQQQQHEDGTTNN